MWSMRQYSRPNIDKIIKKLSFRGWSHSMYESIKEGQSTRVTSCMDVWTKCFRQDDHRGIPVKALLTTTLAFFFSTNTIKIWLLFLPNHFLKFLFEKSIWNSIFYFISISWYNNNTYLISQYELCPQREIKLCPSN